VASLAQWAAQLSASLTTVDATAPDPGSFGGQLCRSRSGDLQLVQATAAAHVLARPTGAVADPACSLLVAQTHEAWHVRQGPTLLSLRAGDVVLLDMAGPLELHFPRGCACLYIRLPAPWVGRWLRSDGRPGPRVAWRDKGWGMSLSALFRQLAEAPQAVEQYRGAAFGEHLGAMLSAALEPAGSDEPRMAADLVAQALECMHARIDQPALCAAAVAAQLRVSVRTLHRGFAATDRPFAATLRQMRMQRAAELLRTPQLRGLSVAQVGARCGYPEGAHFGRAFQREWGSSPAAWRRSALGSAGAPT
jgi:AraC family transcriptional activator of tynA and feaB